MDKRKIKLLGYVTTLNGFSVNILEGKLLGKVGRDNNCEDHSASWKLWYT